MSRSAFYRRFEDIFTKYDLSYFQGLDELGEFPVLFFTELSEVGLLTYNMEDMKGDMVEFSDIASLIGAHSIAAAICWVMHNQQYDCLVKANKNHLVSPDELIASVTTQPNAGSVLTKNDYRLNRFESTFDFSREAPIVSFGHIAKYFLATLSLSCNEQDVWLCLLDRSHVVDCVDNPVVSNSCRSARNQKMRFSGSLSSERIVASMESMLHKSVAPISHIGWMSAYLGGVKGVVNRLRSELRQNTLIRGRSWKDSLLMNRFGTIISKIDMCEAFIYRCASIDSENIEEHSRIINSLKVVCSDQLFQIVDLIKIELGMTYAVTKNDPLGLEIVGRDVESAQLMFHNDKIIEFIFRDWFLYGER